MPYLRYSAAQKRAYALRMKRKRSKAPVRRRAKRAYTKNKVIARVVKKTLSSRIEKKRNASRSLYEIAASAPNFGGCAYFLGNLGGQAPITGSSFSPMQTIAAVNASAFGWGSNNQVYFGKEIAGKYMKTNITLTLPSFRSVPVGGADFQQLPLNYNYRAIFFRQKDRPGTSQATTGLARRPAYSLFQNDLGTKYGPLSDPGLAVPDLTGTAIWTNNDLMISKFNRENFTILKEQRGNLSLSQSLNATSNNAVVTAGGARFPSEAQINYYHPINKKLQMELTDKTTPGTPTTPLTYPLNYNTTIGVMIVLNPLGEPANYESTWNNVIEPYININNTFVFTDP